MRVKFNNAAEELFLKGLMEQLVKEYQEITAQLQDDVRAENARFKDAWESNTYLPEYLIEQHKKQISSLEGTAAARARALNQKAIKAVEDLKGKVAAALDPKEQPSDFAVRVNNALQFIQLEGEGITDQAAAEILHDFIPYADTMQRFRRVIERQTANVAPMEYPDGSSRFPMTFGRLDHAAQFQEAINELERIAGSIFLRDPRHSEEECYNGVNLSVPMSGYMQLVEEINICDQAEQIERMAGELFPTQE